MSELIERYQRYAVFRNANTSYRVAYEEAIGIWRDIAGPFWSRVAAIARMRQIAG